MISPPIRSAPLPTTLRLNIAQRACFVGKTGTGKTYLVNKLTAPVRRMWILDPKGMMDLIEWNAEPLDLRSAINSLDRGRSSRAYFGPRPREEWDEIFTAALGVGNLLVYVDEMYLIVPPQTRAPESLIACITTGRQRGVGLWTATQRPTWIPLFALSESEWFFVFSLFLPQDRKRMADASGMPQFEVPIKHEHGFWLYNQLWKAPRYVPRWDE